MWFDPFSPSRNVGRRRPDPDLDRLLASALVVAGALAVATALPAPQRWLVFGGLMEWAAIAAMLVAMFRDEDPFSRQITTWDQAAIFALLAMGCHLLTGSSAVDLLAAEEAVRPAAIWTGQYMPAQFVG